MEFTQWTPEEVANKMTEAGLGEFSTVFVEQDIGGEVLRDLTELDLRKLGLSAGGQIYMTRWIVSLNPIPHDETPINPIPYEETCGLPLDDQYEFMEPQYRDGTLRRECSFCKRKFALHRVDHHEASCWARPRPCENCEQESDPVTVKPLTSFPCSTCGQEIGQLQLEGHEMRCAGRQCGKFREDHKVLCGIIQQAKRARTQVTQNSLA
jgi:hypothetical protein